MSEQAEVLQHISRPDLPWRRATLTRCGREIAELAADRVVTVDEARKKVDRLGKTRAVMFLCMTCIDRWHAWPEWDESPAGLIGRYSEGASWARRNEDGESRFDGLNRELRALAILAQRYEPEFRELLSDQESGALVALSEHRKGRR